MRKDCGHAGVPLSEILIVSIEAKTTSSTASGKSRELSKQLPLVGFTFIDTQITCSCSRFRERAYLVCISVVAKLESA